MEGISFHFFTPASSFSSRSILFNFYILTFSISSYCYYYLYLFVLNVLKLSGALFGIMMCVLVDANREWMHIIISVLPYLYTLSFCIITTCSMWRLISGFMIIGTHIRSVLREADNIINRRHQNFLGSVTIFRGWGRQLKSISVMLRYKKIHNTQYTMFVQLCHLDNMFMFMYLFFVYIKTEKMRFIFMFIFMLDTTTSEVYESALHGKMTMMMRLLCADNFDCFITSLYEWNAVSRYQMSLLLL